MPHKTAPVLFAIGLVAAFALLTACGEDEDDNGNGNGSGAGGEVSFEISGSIEGSKEGNAGIIKVDEGIETLSFNFYDSSPQTFSIGFNRLGDGLDVPEVGTYSLGGPNDADFHVVYTDTETGDEYSTFDGQAGSMEVTDSSDSSVSGTFSFELEQQHQGEDSDSDDGTIVVEDGEFSAPVQ